MTKQLAILGIFASLSIVGIVLFVNGTISGLYFAEDDYYVRPSGIQFRVESGVAVLQSDVAVNQVCRNAVPCDYQSSYTCCTHDGSDCIVPSQASQSAGSCPLSHRSRCQCREDYVAGLVERYG